MTRQDAVELAGAGSVREARAFVRRTLGDWGLDALADTVLLLTSELATNAVLHARSAYAVSLRERDEVLRVTVSDRSSTGPHRRTNALHAGTGRGLALVATMADAWGSTGPSGGFAKSVWFEVSTDPARQQEGDEGALYGEDWLAMAQEL